MSRALFLWISCLSITVAAVGMAHGLIVVLTLFRHNNQMVREMFLSVSAAALLPLFFLGMMVACAICLFVWSIKNLFNRNSHLPDFM